jgi:hypothetical protein
MADIKLADGVRWLNERYDAELTYQQLYMLGLQRRIPVERNETGRFWVIDEANLPRIAKILGLSPAKSKAKHKPAADKATKPKAAISKPARERAGTRPSPRRSAA